MKQTSLKLRLAEAEAAVFEASALVRKQQSLVADLRNNGRQDAIAQAQALLELLEDRLRNRLAERSLALRSYNPADIGEDE